MLPDFRKLRFILLIFSIFASANVIADDLIKVLKFSNKAIYVKEDSEVKLKPTSMFEGHEFFVKAGPDESNFFEIVNKEQNKSYWVLGSGIVTEFEKISIDCKTTKNQFAYDSNLYGPRGAGETC